MTIPRPDAGAETRRIVQLIKDTFSGNPPYPYGDARQLEEQFFDHFYMSRRILLALANAHPNHPWNPDRVDLLEDKVDETRYEELSEGAPLTPQEKELFQKAAEEEEPEIAWMAQVYRLSAPPESGESRAVFFAWTGMQEGQHSDVNFFAGPFRDVMEAITFIQDNEGSADRWSMDSDFPESAPLKVWMALQQKAQG